MKKSYILVSIFVSSLCLYSCNGNKKEEVKLEKKIITEDEISDEEFEKEMEELDEDVENMDSKTEKTTTIETTIEDGKKVVKEEKIIIKK